MQHNDNMQQHDNTQLSFREMWMTNSIFTKDWSALCKLSHKIQLWNHLDLKKSLIDQKVFEDISKFTYDHYQLMMVSELRSPFTSIFTHIACEYRWKRTPKSHELACRIKIWQLCNGIVFIMKTGSSGKLSNQISFCTFPRWWIVYPRMVYIFL